MSDQRFRGTLLGGPGTSVPPTATLTGAERVGLAQGRYFDAAYNRKLFWAASQAATTWSVALATTHTGFVNSNPANSQVNLSPLLASFALSVAPAGIAHISLFSGWTAGGITAHTTPLDVLSTYLNDGGGGVGKADGAATLVGTPRYGLPIMGGFTAGALHGTSPSLLDLGGAFLVPPGGYFGLAALTAVIGFAGIVWEEIPILQS